MVLALILVKILLFKSLNKKEKQTNKQNKVLVKYRTRRGGVVCRHLVHWATSLGLLNYVNFTTYFFFRDKLPTNMKMLVFFLANCVRDHRKKHGCEQKKTQKTLALLYSASRSLRNAANASTVPAEFAAESTTKMKS